MNKSFFIVVAMVSGCASSASNSRLVRDAESHPGPQRATSTVDREIPPVRAVPIALVAFYQDKGQWPVDFEELRSWLAGSGKDTAFLSVCADLLIRKGATPETVNVTFKIHENQFAGNVEITLPAHPKRANDVDTNTR